MRTGAGLKKMRRGRTCSRRDSPGSVSVLRPLAGEAAPSRCAGRCWPRRLDSVPSDKQPVRRPPCRSPDRIELQLRLAARRELCSAGEALHGQPRVDGRPGRYLERRRAAASCRCRGSDPARPRRALKEPVVEASNMPFDPTPSLPRLRLGRRPAGQRRCSPANPIPGRRPWRRFASGKCDWARRTPGRRTGPPRRAPWARGPAVWSDDTHLTRQPMRRR